MEPEDGIISVYGHARSVTGRFGPPYGTGFGRVIYVVSDVVMDVVNEVSERCARRF
jgi:hypothetical protein